MPWGSLGVDPHTDQGILDKNRGIARLGWGEISVFCYKCEDREEEFIEMLQCSLLSIVIEN